MNIFTLILLRFKVIHKTVMKKKKKKKMLDIVKLNKNINCDHAFEKPKIFIC
jgi:hypothetical protein